MASSSNGTPKVGEEVGIIVEAADQVLHDRGLEIVAPVEEEIRAESGD